MLEQGVALKNSVDVASVRRHRLDGLALKEDAPLRRLLEAGDHAQGRRLAASRRPQERKELAAADLDPHVLDRLGVPVALGDAVEPDRRLGGARTPLRNRRASSGGWFHQASSPSSTARYSRLPTSRGGRLPARSWPAI